MINKNRQQGMTLIGWAIILSMVAVIGLFGLRIFTPFMESLTVETTLEGLQEDIRMGQFSGSNPSAIRNELIQRLVRNQANDKAILEGITIAPGDGGFVVQIKYERREKFFANIYIVLAFEPSVTVPRN